MKTRLIGLLCMLVLLGGCSSCDESCYKAKAEYEKQKQYTAESTNSCKGLMIGGFCYKNVVDYCNRISDKSERDGERNQEQWDAYARCIEVNRGLFG